VVLVAVVGVGPIKPADQELLDKEMRVEMVAEAVEIIPQQVAVEWKW
jgi:hypothetical protein